MIGKISRIENEQVLTRKNFVNFTQTLALLIFCHLELNYIIS